MWTVPGLRGDRQQIFFRIFFNVCRACALLALGSTHGTLTINHSSPHLLSDNKTVFCLNGARIVWRYIFLGLALRYERSVISWPYYTRTANRDRNVICLPYYMWTANREVCVICLPYYLWSWSTNRRSLLCLLLGLALRLPSGWALTRTKPENVYFLGLALRLPSWLPPENRCFVKQQIVICEWIEYKQGVLLDNKLSFLSVLSLEMCNLLLCKYNQFTCK